MVFQLMRWMDQHKGTKDFFEMAPHTAFDNSDIAQLTMGKDLPIEITNLQNFPSHIQLKAKLQAIKEAKDVTVTFMDQGQMYMSVPLYPGDVYQNYDYERVEIHYLGMGDYQDPEGMVSHTFKGVKVPWGTLEMEGTLLYRHDFITQHHPYEAKAEEDVQEVCGYGGYYRLGGALEEIQQIFFTPAFEDQRSTFYLSSLSDWQQKGLYPPRSSSGEGRVISFKNCGEEPMENLKGALQNGRARLRLTSGCDEGGEEVSAAYQSVDALIIGQDIIMIDYKKE